MQKLKNGEQVSEYPFYAYKSLRLLWPWLQLMDSLLYANILIRFSRLFNDFIIIDRSAVDNYVDVLADIHEPLWFNPFHSLFLALIPENSLVILFDVDEKTARIRKRDVPNLFSICKQRALFKSLQHEHDWPIISTDLEFDVVHKQLIGIIKGLNGSNN